MPKHISRIINLSKLRLTCIAKSTISLGTPSQTLIFEIIRSYVSTDIYRLFNNEIGHLVRVGTSMPSYPVNERRTIDK